MNTKLFNRNFIMVVIGQIISLFGNNILRYALPLYLLNQTGSASLYGVVLALSFVPMLLMSPIGGIVADRVNKRNIMVILDFFTAFLILLFTLTYQKMNLTAILVLVLMLLYGIQGAYQPSVQASIPVLVPPQNLMSGNAIINMVMSLSGILGPVLGGVLFGFWGLKPVLIVSIICFLFSAVMEIFIRIPFEKRENRDGILYVAVRDMKDSFYFICYENTSIVKIAVLLTIVNMVFSALVIIGLPIIVNIHLGFDQSTGNRMYGYAQGFLAAGGLLGGLLSGVLGSKLNIRHGAGFIFACTATLCPIGICLLYSKNAVISYIIIVTSCFVMMVLSTLLSIEMITYVQKCTPQLLIGKVMALLTCIVMCGSPIGQAVYGVLFDMISNHIYYIYFGAFAICMILGVISMKIFTDIKE